MYLVSQLPSALHLTISRRMHRYSMVWISYQVRVIRIRNIRL